MAQRARIDWDTQQRSAAVFDEHRELTALADLAIGSSTRARLRLVADEVSADEDRQFRRLLPGASSKARSVSRHWEFGAPAQAVDEILSDASAFATGARTSERARLRRAA